MKKSKLVFVLVLVLGLAILSGGCGGESATNNANNGEQSPEEPAVSESASALQTIKDRGVLVVGLDDSYPPMGYRDDKNQLIGFDIDMGNEIGKRMGVKVEWQPTDWDGVIASLQSKNSILLFPHDGYAGKAASINLLMPMLLPVWLCW